MHKKVIITGTGKGIGKALAIGLSRKGFTVTASGRKLKDMQALEERLTGNYLIEDCDISKWDDCQRIVEKTIQKFGKIDILINNASGWLAKSLLDASKEEIQELIQTTVTGNLFITKLCLEQMKKQQSGYIISLLPSSFPDKMEEFNGTILTPYYAAKFGEAGMTEALKLEAKKYDVSVTSLYLGTIASNFDIDDPEEKIKELDHPAVHVKEVVDTIENLIKREDKTPTVTLETK